MAVSTTGGYTPARIRMNPDSVFVEDAQIAAATNPDDNAPIVLVLMNRGSIVQVLEPGDAIDRGMAMIKAGCAANGLRALAKVLDKCEVPEDIRDGFVATWGEAVGKLDAGTDPAEREQDSLATGCYL